MNYTSLLNSTNDIVTYKPFVIDIVVVALGVAFFFLLFIIINQIKKEKKKRDENVTNN